MPKLVLLGTSTNVPDVDHENSHMVLVGDERMVLIDGPGNPFVRLRQAGLDENKLTDVVATHFHPDHVAGIPLLLMGMGLSGRKDPLTIHANAHCKNYLEQVLTFYQWKSWHFFPVTFNTLPEEELHLMLDTEDFRILTSPVKHFIPTLGLRVELRESGKVLAYTCDSAPTPSLIGLAKDADVLIHEAAGASIGHSSAKQAGEMATKAKAKSLYLIHYPVNGYDYQGLAVEAAEAYEGPVEMAEDFMEFEF